MELTSAQKNARTRSINKADKAYEEMCATQYKEWVDALNRFCPPRDAVIDALEAKRDEAIAKIKMEYQKEYEMVMESFNNLMKPTDDALALARKNAWAIYGKAMIGEISFDEAVAK